MGKKELRVVLDTNVLVSALFFKGELSKLLFPLKKFILLFSEETLNEFIKVLHYPKFSLTEDEIEYLLQFEILPYSKIVEVTFKFDKEICPNKDDQKFLELAVSAKANYIITGDKDLLNLKEINKIKILSPKEFLSLLKKKIKH
ncbi:MAG: putative nucleic acid-binding protein [Thermodesulfobacterium sp.]|uniref:Nucleic acid-binding protein n=1 Tax=Candidatus Thermodesulfobacterium syntrophicum TaxID=3060442 RepID=A0AAE3P4E3_9BACT|nr:putative nucleic acid-binding protein [Candidatus Thermodesulfobacterium syntrophicum]